ncbi:MAG: VWA domain-containing protein, partial [Planctomycetales bacterium]
KVWSKTDRLYIKEYEEETNLNCTFVVDCSKSMRYGNQSAGGWSKFDHAATAAASLAHLLQRQQDSVGLVTFNTAIEKNIPPGSHPSHLKRLVYELEQTRPDSQTDVAEVFHQLAGQIRRRGIVVLISDLFAETDTLHKSLQLFRLRGHEVIVFHVMHGEELTFPFQDNLLFRGLEVDQQLLTDPRALRKSYLSAVERYRKRVQASCTSMGLDYVLLNTHHPLDAALAAYLSFRRRAARKAARR